MSKKSKKNDRLKLPKRFAGVKIPKDTRKSINRLLKDLPSPAAKPLLTAAVGALVTALAARIEDPLREMIEKRSGPAKPRESPTVGAPTAH